MSAAVAPNIGRMISGCGVGIEALASPICAKAMKPLFSTISGRAPKKAGFHSTRSATLPFSTDPIRWLMPWAMAPLIVYLATKRLMRKLSLPATSSGSLPRWRFIWSAICQVRVTTSPARPIAWLSDVIIEIAPRSCMTPSAAMVSARMRLAAKATSSGMFLSRWWQTISMSRCSATVLTV